MTGEPCLHATRSANAEVVQNDAALPDRVLSNHVRLEIDELSGFPLSKTQSLNASVRKSNAPNTLFFRLALGAEARVACLLVSTDGTDQPPITTAVPHLSTA